MLRQKATTVSLGLLALLFSPILLAVVLFVFAVAAIVLCPETRARRVAAESSGCMGCESYSCPALVAIVMVGLPVLLLIARFVYRRLQFRSRSLTNSSTAHHS
jgi:uncharacterized membrane protein